MLKYVTLILKAKLKMSLCFN